MRNVRLRYFSALLGVVLSLAVASPTSSQTSSATTLFDLHTPDAETPVLVPVRQIDGDKFGYIDAQGKVVIGFNFDMASHFHEGLAEVYLNGKCGYIDTQGELAISYQRCHLFGDFQEGFAVVSFKGGGKWYFMDTKGKLLRGAAFYSPSAFSEGLAAVRARFKSDCCWGFIGRDGRLTIPPKFDSLPGNFSEGVAYARSGGKVGFIDKQGDFVVPPRFEAAGGFSEGLAPVQLDGKWGFIDHQGEFVIRPQFAFARSFSEGLAVAYASKGKTPYEDKVGYIDRQGHWVAEPNYQQAGPFQGGRGIIEKTGHFGLLDSSGIEVVPAQYQDAFYVGFGLWYGRTENESHTVPEIHIFDKQGKVIYRYDNRSPSCMREHPPFPNPDQVSITLEPLQATVRAGASVPFHVATHGFTTDEFIFFDWEAEDKDGKVACPLSSRWNAESCPMGYLGARHTRRHGPNVEGNATYFAPKVPGTYYVFVLAWDSEQCGGIRRVEKRVTATISVIP